MFAWGGECEVEHDDPIRGGARIGAGRHKRARPDDFEERYIRIGRLRCQEEYCANRTTVNRWLDEGDKQDLIARRAEHVRDKRRAPRITRTDMRQVLAEAFPLPDERVSLTEAAQAARFLQQRRNGGWVIFRAQGNMWWMGTRKRTAAEVIHLARSKGFKADLSGDANAE